LLLRPAVQRQEFQATTAAAAVAAVATAGEAEGRDDLFRGDGEAEFGGEEGEGVGVSLCLLEVASTTFRAA
jgi:hypothetical protein